jgi:hypothetical protein
MNLAAHLSNFTTLTPPELSRKDSPAERERRKTAQQRAEDFIYTLNHAVTCLSLTDFVIAPFFSSVFGWNICGHGHDHKKDGTSSHSSGSSNVHEHYPGCGHDHSAASASSAFSSGGAAAATPSASTPVPDAAKAPRIGGGMRHSKFSWKHEKPLMPPKKTAVRGAAFGALLKKEASLEDGEPLAEGLLQDVSDRIKKPTPPQKTITYGGAYSYASEPKTFGEKVKAQWGKAKAWMSGKLKLDSKAMKEWFIGEAVGDLGAVPVTLAVQHFTPGIMTGIQRGLEPIVGRMMHRRAEKAAARWADANGIARDAKEVVDHAESLYQYEIRHLPQMVMWTLSSIGINYGVMKFRNPELSIANFAKGKVAGAAITAGLVFGTRTLVPDKAHAWDTTVSSKVVVPVVKKVGRIFGIDERDVDDFSRRQHRDSPGASWTDRVAKGDTLINVSPSQII